MGELTTTTVANQQKTGMLLTTTWVERGGNNCANVRGFRMQGGCTGNAAAGRAGVRIARRTTNECQWNIPAA